MARIMLCLSNGFKDGNVWKPICFYEQLINALMEEGNDVLLYIPNKFHSCVFGGENNMFSNVDEDELVEDIKAFNPELVIAFNNATYHKILDVTDCRVVVWDADLVPLWSQVDLIKNNLDRYVFFSFAEYTITKEQDAIGFKDEQSAIIPQGTCMRNTNAEKTVNISFLGTKFNELPTLLNLIQKHAGKRDFAFLAEQIKKAPFVDKGWLISRIEDQDLKADLSALPSSDIPYFFAGENRIRVLQVLSDLGLDLYAQNEWITLASVLPSLAACDTRRIVFSYADNERIYNQSKICLNIQHTQASRGISWRIPDIMATGGCLVSSYSPAIKERFKNYVDVPMFDNEYDARTLCQKILNDEAWRADIVAGSNAAIEKEGRWIHSIKKMEDFLNMKLTQLPQKGKLQVLEPVVKKSFGTIKDFGTSTSIKPVSSFTENMFRKVFKLMTLLALTRKKRKYLSQRFSLRKQE